VEKWKSGKVEKWNSKTLSLFHLSTFPQIIHFHLIKQRLPADFQQLRRCGPVVTGFSQGIDDRA
jgi:hypothetical protein